ncbi:MAG: hypothetical protein PQJ45_12170 [Sphaerochaetaceae bacterium]|nr:hypothetical protein [Sphaerochaetaceae bacterium]MDC7238514.1 hypothetical protein [Sphaerochaetaceae bacterium]
MDKLLEKYKNLNPDSSIAKIEKTAQDLKRRQYMPPFILEVKDFLHMTKEKMLEEYKRVMDLSSEDNELKSVISIEDPNDIKIKHLTTLLNQYLLLCGLREGDPNSWDIINELYEDD